MREIIKAIKKFCDSVVCLIKGTILLSRDIFCKKEYLNLEYRDLAPIDDASGCEEHIKVLEWAIGSNRIKNIALSGPYGSGKSSIIETFLRRNPLVREKSIKISLATFTEETDEEPVIISEDLEEGILKQLFYKIKQSKIPQSRYRKLHKIEYWPIFGKIVICTLVGLALLFVFLPNIYDNGCNLIVEAGYKIYNVIKAEEDRTISEKLLANISYLSFSLFSLGILAGIARILHLFATLLSIKEIKLPADTTIGQRDSDGESIFNKNMDEIIYFFEATNFRIVFIEDLDRFKDPEIFVQLRELNTLLNGCETIKEPVIFVYAIRDDMFKDAERTKFFDFIIPVIPIINSTNSCESFLEMLHQSELDGIKHNISRAFVLDISPFISDMRILQNIYNEFILYKATLKTGQNLTLHDEQMMALVVFKNLFPGEFADLQAEKGAVKEAFRNKAKFVEKKREAVNEQIYTKTKTLEGIAADTLNSAKELKYLMLCAVSAWKGIAYRLSINGGAQYTADAILQDDFDMANLLQKKQWYVYYSTKTGSSSSDWTDVPSLCAPFIERYKYLQYADEVKQQELKAEIEALEGRIHNLSKSSLQTLIEKYGTDEVLTSENVRTNDLLMFLLRKGYINEEYAGYINFFKDNSITTQDMNFILSIKNQKPLPFNYSLTKISETLERLQVHEFGEKAILNFDLLRHMLMETHYKAQLKAFFEQLSDESQLCWSFINEFIDYEESQQYFVKRLAIAWPGLWEAVYFNDILTYDRKIKYLVWLIAYTDHEIHKLQNDGNLISQFFIEHEDILQKLPSYLSHQVTDIIKELNIVFAKIEIRGVPTNVLDFIFDNRYYELNADMIRSIVTYKNAPLAERLAIQNYTVISELGYDALTNMVHDNWEMYVKQIVLAEENTQEGADAILSILRRSITNTSLCKQIIMHAEFHIDDITRVCADMIDEERENIQVIWDTLFETSKINISWINVYCYWKEFGLYPTILNYISANYSDLSSSEYECLDDDFKRDIILSEISLDVFVELLPYLRMDDFNIGLEDISAEKLHVMIEHQNFDFTIANYKELAGCAPDFCALFILINQEAFAEEMEDIQLTERVFEELILSPDMNSAIKQHVVNRDGVRLITKKTATYLCQQDLNLDRTVFNVIWEETDSAQRKDFLHKHISMLEVDDFDRYFADLGAPYDKLKRKPYRHDEFIPDTVENRELVGRLQYLQYLTSWEYETQIVYGPKRTEKKVPVIRCRVKAKVEDKLPL